MNICINIHKGDKTKVKRNVVLGAMSEFATGSAAPESVVLPTATVLNVSTLGIPVVLNTQTNSGRESAEAESAEIDDSDLRQLKKDIGELKTLVGQLAAREAARSELDAIKLKP